jgi:diacylglycerol kinase family enzyme
MLSKLLDEQFELRAFLTKINEKDLDNRNYNFALEITIFMKKNKVEKQILTNKTRVFELGAEGGSLSIYQFLDKDNKDWYFHNVNDMGLDDEIPATNRNSEYSMSYAEAFIKMQTKYPNLFNLHPLYVHPDFVNETILFLKECLVENKEYVDYYTWAAVLKVREEELGR